MEALAGEAAPLASLEPRALRLQIGGRQRPARGQGRPRDQPGVVVGDQATRAGRGGAVLDVAAAPARPGRGALDHHRLTVGAEAAHQIAVEHRIDQHEHRIGVGAGALGDPRHVAEAQRRSRGAVVVDRGQPWIAGGLHRIEAARGPAGGVACEQRRRLGRRRPLEDHDRGVRGRVGEHLRRAEVDDGAHRAGGAQRRPQPARPRRGQPARRRHQPDPAPGPDPAQRALEEDAVQVPLAVGRGRAPTAQRRPQVRIAGLEPDRSHVGWVADHRVGRRQRWRRQQDLGPVDRGRRHAGPARRRQRRIALDPDQLDGAPEAGRDLGRRGQEGAVTAGRIEHHQRPTMDRERRQHLGRDQPRQPRRREHLPAHAATGPLVGVARHRGPGVVDDAVELGEIHVPRSYWQAAADTPPVLDEIAPRRLPASARGRLAHIGYPDRTRAPPADSATVVACRRLMRSTRAASPPSSPSTATNRVARRCTRSRCPSHATRRPASTARSRR